MSATLHQQATTLFDSGEQLERDGDIDGARVAFITAAQLEETAFATVPPERIQTRSILANSVVSLLRRAGRLEEAGAAARRLMGSVLTEEATDYLLSTATEARWLQSASSDGYRYEGTLRVALDGPAVRPGGLVWADTALLKLDQLRQLLWRVGEMVAGFPLRTKGGAPQELMEAVRPFVSPAAPGSYSFHFRVETKPEQLEMFRYRTIDAGQITRRLYDLLHITAEHGYEGIVSEVDDPGYQDVLLRSLRNFAPNGSSLSAITVRPTEGVTEARLVPDQYRSIGRQLRKKRGKSRQGDVTSPRGVLRGLDLDDRHIVLRGPDGGRFLIDPGAALDDLIGPLVNHIVEVYGEMRHGHLYVSDVYELIDD